MYSWLRTLRSSDWLLTAAVLFLLILGLTVIYGISLNDPTSNFQLFKKQLLFVGIGLLGFFVLTQVNYRLWQTLGKVIYGIFVVVLLGVLVFGTTIRGTTGWIQFGGFGLQPVEFAKISVIIFLAQYFNKFGREFFLWRHIIVSGISVMLIVGLVLLQPDLGSSMVMFATWVLMLLIGGIKKSQLAILFTLFVMVSVVSWFFVFKPYQKDRIMTFINPQSNPQNEGYNVRQSIIAVGSGQLWGRGFGLGSQSQLHFLPEPETDFIYAVLAEEFGFVGVLLLIGAYAMILYRLIRLANRTRDNYAAYFCLGLAAMLLVQLFINIGMNMGIAPVTGIPLPFISAGGSSIIALLAALGMANNMAIESK
jgi:rod shape determining protein RodA